MNPAALPTLTALALLWQQAPPRPEWNQTKAVEKVQRAVDLEKSGEKPWEKIAWTTDPEEAVKRAGQDRKPIVVFLFKKLTQEWDGPEQQGRC
jgi:hypothetical protein